ncbi:hypothetical protein Syncc8109_2311 [Synechococcus sp. WH 8109]|nr:hypothetical protein Syncc8109_2311 [Synechococcus sp. WH 8109]
MPNKDRSCWEVKQKRQAVSDHQPLGESQS